jgi:hypothetical protein
MWKDEIVEEIHRIREEHAKAFNYDLKAMVADWQEKQAASGRKMISVPLKPNKPKTVVLDDDVAQVFTTPESVNNVLRALIQTMPSPSETASTCD